MASTSEPPPSEALHPYYRLLPSYITPESIHAEHQDFISRIQESLNCLRSLHNEDPPTITLQKRHFRDIDTLFKLKHELPAPLHAQLIHILVELLWTHNGRSFVDVDMEIRAIEVLQLLLEKWKKRRRSEDVEEIFIDWRSARRAVERVCFRESGSFQLASQSYLTKLATLTVKCAEVARSFYHASDPNVPFVVELWAEFGVTIKEVKTTECFRALALFSFFLALPGSEDLQVAEQKIVTLLPDWFSTWTLISRCGEWDGHWMKILSRVAKKFPSTSILNDYFPFLYAKVTDILELPSDLGAPFKKKSWPSVYSSINGSKRLSQHAMRLCVYLLGDAEVDGADAAPIRYLLEILSLLKSFFHPSNVANIGNSLSTFTYYLSNSLGKRHGNEKKGATGLQVNSVHKIVVALQEICFLGIYSNNQGVATKCMYVLKNLLCIDPAHCVAPVMEEMLKALDPMAMSHSHLAVTAISSMAVFSYQLMCGQHPESTGLFFSTYLKPILELTLPGIDANDEKKTQSTLQLYFRLLSWLPLINDPAKGHFQATKQRREVSNQLFVDMEKSLFAEIAPLGSEIDEQMWEIGPFLEEWALAVLDRCFQFIQSRSGARSSSSSTDDSRSNNGKSSNKEGSEDAIVLQVLNLLSMLYDQMSPEIYQQAVRKTVTFVSNVFYTTSFGRKVISQLIFTCLQGDPSQAIAQFLPLVLEKCHVAKIGVDVSSLMKNEKMWYLQVLKGLVRFSPPNDRVLLRYQHELRTILDYFLKTEEDKEVQEVACSVLRHLLIGLLGVYTYDFRSLPAEKWENAISNETGAFQYLGVSFSWGKLSVMWHEPNEEELSFGFDLLQAYVSDVLVQLEQLQQKKDLTVRSWTRLLNQISAGLYGAANILVDETVEADSALLSGSTLLLRTALANDTELLDNIVALKGAWMNQIHKLVVYWRENGSGNAMEIQVWRVLLNIMSQLLIWRGEHLDEFGIKENQNLYSKITALDVPSHAYRKIASTIDHMPKEKLVPLLSRNDLVEKVIFFYSKRKVQQHFALANEIMRPEGDSDTRQRYASLLVEVENLMKNMYVDVRLDATAVMKECSVLYARWIYSHQSKLVEELEALAHGDSSDLKEEQVSGLLRTLSWPLASRNLWKNRDTFLTRVFVVLLKSNDTIVKQVDTEAGKVKVEVKLRTFFLSLLSNWRCIRGQNVSFVLETLVTAEPSSTEHWKFQLMHLVMLYPFLQKDSMPISVDVWKLVIRRLTSDVLPLRQIALELLKHLLKLLKHSRKEIGSENVEAIETLIYSAHTMQRVLNAVLNNHKNSNRFAASADGQHAESAPSDWSFGVSEFVRYITSNSQSYPKAAPLSSMRLLNQSSETFGNVSLSNVKLVQKLVQENPTAFVESGAIGQLRNLADENIGAEVAEEDRQAALKTLADWITAVLHALAKIDIARISEEEISKQITSFVELLKTILPQVSIVLIDQWVEVAYLIFRPSRSGSVKLVRLKLLMSYLLQELEVSFTRATAEDYARQAKWLALVESMGVHLLAANASASDEAIHALASAFNERVLTVIRQHALTHQYKIIRDRVGKMLFLLGAYVSRAEAPVDMSALPLDQLLAASALPGEDVDNEQESGDSELDESLHAKETAMQWLSCCEKFGDVRDALAVLNELLPIALLAQSHQKAEVAVQAKNASNAVSLTLRMYFVPQDSTGENKLNNLLELLERLSTSRVWKTRGAVLRFTMTISFYHWVFLSSELKQRVHRFVCTFLTDKQREVQAMAKYALRGLIHNEQNSVVEAMSLRLREATVESRVKFLKLKRRSKRQEADSALKDELKKTQDRLLAVEEKMMESVLSLSAIVLAFPHDVPSFVPPIFEELGPFLYMKKSSNTISFLEKAVKETLLDFKRTHQDNWLEIKSKFTQPQLDVIEDVAIAPSYFS